MLIPDPAFLPFLHECYTMRDSRQGIPTVSQIRSSMHALHTACKFATEVNSKLSPSFVHVMVSVLSAQPCNGIDLPESRSYSLASMMSSCHFILDREELRKLVGVHIWVYFVIRAQQLLLCCDTCKHIREALTTSCCGSKCT